VRAAPQPPASPEPGDPSAIGPGAAFEGCLVFRGSTRVEGRLAGKVVAEGCLEIGPQGWVQAEIEVDELVVAGHLEGEVHARERVELLATARVTANLRTPRLALAEGCRFEGRCETEPESD
jgi:cytoskeletal protein CcmA (bactofilin family)